MATAAVAKKPVPETEPVSLERGNTGLGAETFNLDPSKGRVSRYTSMPEDTVTDKIRIYRAMKGEAKSLDTVLNSIIEVENVIVHPVDITDPVTGEVRVGARVVLAAPNGTLVGCVSGEILRSLKDLGREFGPLPWVGGMLVIPRRGTSKTKRTFYWLDLPTEKESADYHKAKEIAAAKAAQSNGK